MTFDLTSKDFSLANARQCAQACRDVYGSANIESAEAHVQVTRLDECFVVAFRGTKNIRDVLTDADAWRENIKGCSVHKGFYASLTTVFSRVEAAVNQNPNLPVIITGHSLGGALAALAAYRCQWNVHSVYTFGQPRTGDRNFAALYDRLPFPSYRVTNGADLIPWIPWLLGQYRATEMEIYFPQGEGGWLVDPAVANKLLRNGWELYREWRAGDFAMLIDHHIDSYIRRLATCA
jgi:pimeloyl-ACP methyl ester carboxylesterase